MYCDPLGELLSLPWGSNTYTHLRILRDTMRKSQGHQRAETVRLVDDGLHIREMLGILVCRKARVADDLVKLRMRLFLYLRVGSEHKN